MDRREFLKITSVELPLKLGPKDHARYIKADSIGTELHMLDIIDSTKVQHSIRANSYDGIKEAGKKLKLMAKGEFYPAPNNPDFDCEIIKI